MPGANLTRIEAEERRAVVLSPVHYSVDLSLIDGPSDFRSVTTITFGALPGSQTFLDLTADEVESIRLNGIELDPGEVYSDHRVALSDLQEHNEVQITAVCQYSNTGEGLHRSVDPSDGNVYMYTQFEVPDARRVYAVFDQPDIKATFDFAVTAPESWLVTSNMPVSLVEDTQLTTAEGTLSDGASEPAKRWVFDTTPVMSSYLTAVCAGPYAEWHTEYQNEDGRTVPMAIYCRQALKDALDKDVDYLFDITKKGMAFYAKSWSIPYPYAKYDQIFVPEYNAGAMENIGMVTIRDQYVFSSKVSDALAERRVVTVLHELAHMWFGDLVTMKWWNDLWLNESFAEFISTLATAEATDWTNAWATFNSGEKSWALRQDQLPTTHPIVAPINDLNDTYVNFDGITYAKGASVLKQLVAYVGREQFFEGIHHYLTKHAYANATLADLLAELEATSGRDMAAWSAQWLEESGVNTISAEVETRSDGAITSLALGQIAPEEHPVLRAHRLAVGFYNANINGGVTLSERFELDVDGTRTEVTNAFGQSRPDLILPNDGDLTYTKVRLDPASLEFTLGNLSHVEDALARSVIWLSLWDMTRDAELPAEDFIDVSLQALASESEATTFRYALAQVSTAAWHYVAPARREEVVRSVAGQLLALATKAEAGSDQQFQLVHAALGYGLPGNEVFAANVSGVLKGTISLDGLQVDNNLKWALIHALATVNAISDDEIDAALRENETTENREFAYGAKAARATPEAKSWAFKQALNNADLTNMQLDAVACGFSSTPSEELATPYAEQYFEVADWIWKNKSFQMADALLRGLYPTYADPARLVELGDEWLASHADADRALRRIVIENVASSRRTQKVREYNTGR